MFLILLAPMTAVADFSQGETACVAKKLNKAKLEKELKASGKVHRKLAKENPLAQKSVEIQDRLLKDFLFTFPVVCELENSVGTGLVEEIQKTNLAYRDCELEFQLYKVYFHHFQSTDQKILDLKKLIFDLGSTDLQGNESTRNLQLDIQKKKPKEFQLVTAERSKLWNSSIGGYRTGAAERAKERPIFTRLNNYLLNTEQRFKQFLETMREKGLFHAERSEKCKSHPTK